MFLPPVLYLVTVQWVEINLANRYSSDMESIYSVESKQLFDGSISLKDSVTKNINIYLNNKRGLLKSFTVDVSVYTKQGVLLYPASFDRDRTSFLPPDPLSVAALNYKLLNEGLVVSVSASLGRNTPLSYLILSVFTILSLLVLYVFYNSGLRKTKRDVEEKNREIDTLLEKEKGNNKKLKLLSDDRKKMEFELAAIKEKLSVANKSEDGMLEELLLLEEKIQINLDLQKAQYDEINDLKLMIDQYKIGKKKGGKSKLKGHDAVARRFKTLYKNIAVSDRAVDGFIDLEEDLKIKCEEVIHQLNETPEIVTIKRKVFGRKGRQTVLEVIFGYKGRLYFRKTKENTIDVLAVGTKNTQARELEFLDKL